MRYLFQCLLFLIGLWTNLSLADPTQHQLPLQYYLDANSKNTVETLSDENFLPFQGLLHKGFTRDTLWIKLDSESLRHGDPNETLVIRVRPSFLDRITLYIPQASGQYLVEESGDMTPWQDVNYPSLNLGFRVKRAELNDFLYLRVQTTSTLMVSVEVMAESDASKADETQKLWYALTLSLIAMFWCWIFISWLQHRDSLRRVFVVKQLFSIFYTLGFFGYYRIFLSDVATPEQINLFFNIVITLVTGTTYWYEFNFVNQYKLIPWIKAIIQAAFVMPLITLALIFLGHTQEGLYLNMLFIGLGTLVLFITGFTLDATQPNPQRHHATTYLFSRTVLVLYYGVLCVALMVNVLAALGLNIGLEFGLHNFVLHGIISGFMMTLLLQIRAYNIEQEVRARSNALYLTQQQLALDQSKRDEQMQFLHMLTHELKTPLSVIDLVLKSSKPNEKTLGYANRAVADMKSIIERCVDVDRIDEGNNQTRMSAFNVKALIQHILEASPATERVIEVQVPDTLNIHSDLQYVRTILGNLIENALRYGLADQPVQIGLAPTSADNPHQLGIVVANTPSNAGWPDPEHVFTKYYRSPKALNMSGTGLGLFLVSRLATILGGRCVYAPTADQVRFILWIPN